MRLLLITDRPFAAREQSMLARIETGLLHEGVRVIRAWPASAPPTLSTTPVERIPYDDRGFSWSVPVRARALADALGALEAAPPGTRPIDIVHAMGEGCFRLAALAASAMGSALAIDLWSPGALAEAERALRTLGAPRHVGAGGSMTASCVCLAPDETMRDAATRALPGVACRHTPWGVHAPSAARNESPDRAKGAPSLFVVGSGEDERACAATLTGLGAACRTEERLVAFVDAAIVRRRPGLWKTLRGAKALERVSLVEGLEARRDLTLEGDILLHPEALGHRRSITLDAMARGLLVIARRDTDVPWLSDGSPALLVGRSDARMWEDAVRSALQDAERSSERASAARAYVEQRCRATTHLRSLLDCYDWMAGAEAIPFPEHAGA